MNKGKKKKETENEKKRHACKSERDATTISRLREMICAFRIRRSE